MSKRFWFGLILVMALGFACAGSEQATETEAPAADESSPPAAETPNTQADAQPDDTADMEGAATSEVPSTPAASAEGGADVVTATRVEMNTSKGRIVLELNREKAPQTVDNFLKYVDNQFYDGTIFHRVKPDFVIQGGGLTEDMQEKATNPPIQNEADNGLQNLEYTICMARTPDPHSATSQFFINTKDNPELDHREKSMRGWGYAVFGKVVEGQDVVDAIEAVPTTTKEGYRDAPVETVLIESVRVVQ